MKILYVSQYFPPEMGAPAARVHELSREWAGTGHEVTVLTGFAHHPTGVKAPEDRGRLTRRESVDGIDLVRTYVYAAPNRGTLRRMVSYASFFASAATIGACRVPRPDVVVATSPQLLCACAGYVLSKLRRAPFVFEVRDLWPESILAVDAMRDNVLVRALKGVARYLYRHSTRIVTVGHGYKRQIEQRYAIAADRMDVVPNGIDTSLFVPGPRENEVRREYGWGDRRVLLYVGTHGMAHALHVVLEAAREFRDEPDKLFVFVGEGARKDQLKRQAAELELTNVQFIDQQPKQRIPLFYAACDIGLVTLRNTPLFQDVLPSKIFEYLGMERPVIISVDGEARRLVEEAGAGEFVPPENVTALVDAVRRLTAAPERLEAMGRSGRQYVLAHYDRKALAARYADLLGSLCADGAARSRPER
jgi:glycosyltransferase involved in cell wall biosynthesis